LKSTVAFSSALLAASTDLATTGWPGVETLQEVP